MIIYDINYQLTNDIDWFIADSNNTIVHFASGGGILPKMVVENIKSNILLINFFREIQNNTDIIVNPTLINYWPPKSISDENLESFKQFARKGIISFDKTYIDNPEDITYHMVTSPNVNLDFRILPNQIKEALNDLKVDIEIKNFHKIDAGYVPWTQIFVDYVNKPIYQTIEKKKYFFW